MKKIVLGILISLCFVSGYSYKTLKAQQSVNVMTIWKNQSANGSFEAPLPGPIAPTATGWEWRMAGYVQNSQSFAWDVIDCRAKTLNGDSLTTVQTKVLVACKAQAAAQNFPNVSYAVIESITVASGF